MKIKKYPVQQEHEDGKDLGGGAPNDDTVDAAAVATDTQPAVDVEPKSALEAVERELAGEPADKKPVEAEGDKKPDAEGDVPADKKQENIRDLHTNYENAKTKNVELEGTLNAIRETVQDAGVNAEEFRSLLDYGKLVKSGNYDQALQILDAQRFALAKTMGKELPGVDLLGQHPDLSAEVNNLQLSRERAVELARQREQQARQQEFVQQRQQEQNLQQQQFAAQEQAITAIGTLGEQWASTDPDYAEKEKVLLKYLPNIRQNFPAHLWPNQIKLLYQTLGDARPVARTPSPLRTGAAGGQRVPRTALEAVEMQIAGNGR